MKRFFGILLIFVIVYFMYFPKTALDYTRNEEQEFESIRLSAAIDYAGEAAMNACMSESLETEYMFMDSMILTPENAAPVFASTLCLSYGIPATEDNINLIESSISVMVLAADDGYYIAEHRKSGNYGNTELIWSPKRSYYIDTNPDSNFGTAYSVELSMNEAVIINKQNFSYRRTDSYSGFPSKEIMYQQINREINRDVNAALKRYGESYGVETIESFYLPVSDSGISGVNRIEMPTLIVLLHNFSINGSKPDNYTSVNGMRVTTRHFITAWTEASGEKYYTAGELDAAQTACAAINGVVFATEAEAAAAGYMPLI